MSDRYRAVIVDDDPALLDGLRVALRAEPYDLHTAGDAAEAFGLISQVRPEVVVSDYQLPGALGTEVLRQAHLVLPDSCRILMTGSPSLEMAVDAVNQGAITRLFLKPFRIIDLARAMREGMERAEMARLSARLLEQARQQREIIERVRRQAPHLLRGDERPQRSPTGAVTADEYHPHDYAGILRGLRQATA